MLSPSIRTLYLKRIFAEVFCVILLNIHICTNSHPVVRSSHWKRKWRNYTAYMSLLLPIKQWITWSLFENDTTWRFWKGNWILRVHMYLLSWRKTNFLCITSILSPKSMSKLINVNCLHFIGCQNYTNVLINRVLYQIQVTALLPFFLSILHLLLQLSKIMLWSTVKLLLAIVMSIIFGPLKTLPRSSKSCDCVTFRVLKYLLSTFLLYTPHCRQYDPLIIETTIGLVLGPCTALCRLFLKHCTLTNRAVGTIWRALSKPPQRRQGPDLRPLWLLVGTPSAIRPELAFSRAEHSLPYSDVTIYIFAILYLSSMLYV